MGLGGANGIARTERDNGGEQRRSLPGSWLRRRKEANDQECRRVNRGGLVANGPTTPKKVLAACGYNYRGKGVAAEEGPGTQNTVQTSMESPQCLGGLSLGQIRNGHTRWILNGQKSPYAGTGRPRNGRGKTSCGKWGMQQVGPISKKTEGPVGFGH